MTNARPYLSLPEVSALLGIAESTLRAHVASGALPAYKLGRQLRFRPDEVEGWVESRRVRPPRRAAHKHGMSMQNRVGAGVPTGGQFAGNDRAESDVDLLEPVDVDLRERLFASEAGYISIAVPTHPDLGDHIAGAHHIELILGRTGKVSARARFDDVNFVQWAAGVKNLDVERDEDEALAYLDSHHGQFVDFLESRGVGFPGEYEWDDSVLTADIELDRDQPITWASAAAALDDAANVHFIRDGLADPNSAMNAGLIRAAKRHTP